MSPGHGLSPEQYARVQCEIIRYHWRNEKIGLKDAINAVMAYLDAVGMDTIDGINPGVWLVQEAGTL